MDRRLLEKGVLDARMHLEMSQTAQAFMAALAGMMPTWLAGVTSDIRRQATAIADIATLPMLHDVAVCEK